jgi:chorismate mutase
MVRDCRSGGDDPEVTIRKRKDCKGGTLGTIAGSLGSAHERGNSFIGSFASNKDTHVRQVVVRAREELVQLLQQRADLMRRIGTLKQTIAGLANIFGDAALSEELLELAGEHKGKRRQPGFTNACRMILMEAARPMSARDVCEKIQEKMPTMLARHRDPMASVATVLNRLRNYGEVEPVLTNGRRAWLWTAEEPPE